MARKYVIDEANILLRKMLTLMESLTIVDSARRQRVAIDIMPTVAVSTLTTLSNFNQSTDSVFLREMQRTNYNTAVRNKLIDI
jgi:hypothetical protein